MSEHLHYFETPQTATVVTLPFPLEEFVRDWSRLRSRMTRELPAAFSRDEWAYLIAFMEHDNLLGVFHQSFGLQVTAPSVPVRALARPRGPVAIWLPNNVSLLGPLTLILLSLTGNQITLKGGSQSEDLAGVFLRFAQHHVPPSRLKSFLEDHVRHETFNRDDPRNREMAAAAMVRIVFGSDTAAAAIHGHPHPLESIGFSFVHRRSEAWLEKAALSDAVLCNLLKVFAIYGQAGCTSPRRVLLLDTNQDDAVKLRDRLVDLWPQVIRRTFAMHVCSGNIMARQWAAALGWDAKLTAQSGAVLAVAGSGAAEFEAIMGLMILSVTREEAFGGLPPNIQTIGHAVANPGDPLWLSGLARTRVKRFVPIAAMHHFGPVWDGQAFWAQAFETINVH